MKKCIDIEEGLEHTVMEVICLKCLHRWIAVFPSETLLKELLCKCGERGYVIGTGQELRIEEVEE